MYKILEKKALAPAIKFMKVDAPLVARKAMPGQFIILRVMEEGERIPLTGWKKENSYWTLWALWEKLRIWMSWTMSFVLEEEWA